MRREKETSTEQSLLFSTKAAVADLVQSAQNYIFDDTEERDQTLSSRFLDELEDIFANYIEDKGSLEELEAYLSTQIDFKYVVSISEVTNLLHAVAAEIHASKLIEVAISVSDEFNLLPRLSKTFYQLQPLIEDGSLTEKTAKAILRDLLLSSGHTIDEEIELFLKSK